MLVLRRNMLKYPWAKGHDVYNKVTNGKKKYIYIYIFTHTHTHIYMERKKESGRESKCSNVLTIGKSR